MVVKLLEGVEELEIPTSDPKYLLSILQAGRKVFPILENWRWKRTPDSILLTSTTIKVKPQKIEEISRPLDYLDIVSLLLKDHTKSYTFTNLKLNEKEYAKLEAFTTKLDITLESTEVGVTIHGKKPEQNIQKD